MDTRPVDKRYKSYRIEAQVVQAKASVVAAVKK